MNREDSENGVVILFSTVNTSNMRNRPFSKSFLFQSEPEWKDFFTKSESILIHIECPTNYRHKIFPTWTRLQTETEGNSEMAYSWVNYASSAREKNILHHLPREQRAREKHFISYPSHPPRSRCVLDFIRARIIPPLMLSLLPTKSFDNLKCR